MLTCNLFKNKSMHGNFFFKHHGLCFNKLLKTFMMQSLKSSKTLNCNTEKLTMIDFPCICALHLSIPIKLMDPHNIVLFFNEPLIKHDVFLGKSNNYIYFCIIL